MYKVMIVDDESWAIRGIRNAFDWDKHGFEIIGQFTSAFKAWEAIREKKPDLVFTDIRMPDISGLDLMKRAKAHDPDIEFVIVSGYAEFEYAQEALRCGALNYFLKPLDIDIADPFIAKLAMHFSERSAARNHLLLDALTCPMMTKSSVTCRFPMARTNAITRCFPSISIAKARRSESCCLWKISLFMRWRLKPEPEKSWSF